MHRLQLKHGDVWAIFDDRDEEVFQGSLSGCECWLDGEENRVAQLAASRSNAGVSHWLLGLWRDRKSWADVHSRSTTGAGHLSHHS